MNTRFFTFMAFVAAVLLAAAARGATDWPGFWQSVESYQAGLGAIVGLFGLAAVTGWALSANRRQAEENWEFERRRANEEEDRKRSALAVNLLAELEDNRARLRNGIDHFDMLVINKGPLLAIIRPPIMSRRVYDSALRELGYLDLDVIRAIGRAYNGADFEQLISVGLKFVFPRDAETFQQLPDLWLKKLRVSMHEHLMAVYRLKSFLGISVAGEYEEIIRNADA